MIKNLYLIIVVMLRLFGLYLVASSLLTWGVGLLLTGGSMGRPLVALLLPILAGILLWLVAKPCATIVTKDLE